jgi:leucyl aminopeptidase
MSAADCFATRDEPSPRPLHLVNDSSLDSWLGSQPAAVRTWLATSRFRAERQQVVVIPDLEGHAAAAVLGLGALADLSQLEPWHTAGLPERLPAGIWALGDELTPEAATAAAYGWAHGSYRFERYRTGARSALGARLVPPAAADVDYVRRAASATAMARDLINTPANDLDPARLASHALQMARELGADGQEILGPALAEQFPSIHAVGRAAAVAPRLVDLSWGDPRHPRVTLVGKGVCFDSGGLDIKPAAGMLLMKKDMGGAACALALARLVIESKLPVRLRVLIPAVENAISGDAYRPGDVLRTRKGLTVEVGNTDAEGRLVLCDALAAADAEQPALLVDLATLTGAARVALGPDLPAVFGNRKATVDELEQQGRALGDPVWPLPLWSGYDDEITSKIADLNNVSSSPFAGAIIGALFLRRFVAATTDWLHIDLYAWNSRDRPGRPVGGDAQTVRALFALLTRRFR